MFRSNEDSASSAETPLVLYGVVGLERDGVRSRSGLHVGNGRRKRMVRLTETLHFAAPDGGSLLVTSHHRGDQNRLEEIRASAPMGPFMASPRGRAARAAWNRNDPIPRPVDVEWTPISILIEGQMTSFEMCDLGDGYWAAVGVVPDATITIDGRKASVDGLSLERLASHQLPPPIAPDIGERTQSVVTSLDNRFARAPFDRVRRWADYWALRDVEIEHVKLLARRERLSEQQREAVQTYWMRRIDGALSETLERLRARSGGAMRQSRLSRRVRSKALSQIWFNTVGPGGRTWFGNRYTTVRHYTFRLRWRP
jgi:hypothetical protein